MTVENLIRHGNQIIILKADIVYIKYLCSNRLSHICAILNGMAGVVVFSAPSAVSSAWFPPGERTTATGIAIVFNNLGNAVSFLLAPAIVPDPPNNRLV